ncbi:hypothetical protein GGF32_001677 [Allomyces javanicus]|nr:hypothetical protein GGF32_001677 [Allomyces javanicus]
MAPLNILNIDLAAIDIKEPMKQEYGAMVYLTYKGGYFPDMVMPDLEVGNAKKFESEKGESFDNYVLFLNFKGADEDSPRGRKLRDVQNKLKAIQGRIKELLLARTADIKKAYPKGKYDEDKIESQFTPILSAYTNEETGMTYPESFKVEIQRQREDKNLFNTVKGKPLLIDRFQNEIPVTIENVFEEIKRGASLKTMLRIGYVFIGKNAITTKIRMVHAVRSKVAPKFESFKLELDDDEFDEADRSEDSHQGLYDNKNVDVEIDCDM